MSKIPLLDLRAQYKSIQKDVDAVMRSICETQNFILGSDVDDLEKEIASYCDTAYAVGVASGTDALKLSLRAAGIGPGDEVITSPFTFIASCGSASELGAIPVFVDIDPLTYEIDAAAIEERITARTKAIIPVHLYGQCADMDAIMDIAKRRGIAVIEDCAQAIGATFSGRKAGSFGLAGAISFFPSKNLGAFGDGGMIVTGDAALEKRLRALRVHGSAVRYHHAELGYNSRLDNLQAAILRVKLRRLDAWAEARRRNAAFFDKELGTVPGITTPVVDPRNVHVYHQYVIAVAPAKRDGLIEHLTRSGIEARVYYPVPLHLQECYRWRGYQAGDFPRAEQAAASTLALPVYPELSLSDRERIVGTIREFMGTPS